MRALKATEKSSKTLALAQQVPEWQVARAGEVSGGNTEHVCPVLTPFLLTHCQPLSEGGWARWSFDPTQYQFLCFNDYFNSQPQSITSQP